MDRLIIGTIIWSIGVICLLISIIILIVDAVKCDEDKIYEEHEYNPCKTDKTYNGTMKTLVAGFCLVFISSIIF